MTIAFLSSWISAFLFTHIVEVPIYSLALRDRPWVERIGLGFYATLATHPVVWFVIWPLMNRGEYRVYVIVAETWAVLGETVFLALIRVRRAFLWALLANAASATLGIFSQRLFGWP